MTRVEALARVVELLEREQNALRERRPAALGNMLLELETALKHAVTDVERPLTPMERSLATIIRRLTQSNDRLLAGMVQPLLEIGKLAKDEGVALALDQHV